MKLVADESVEGPTVNRLREDGHEVLYIAEMEPGIRDPNVLAFAAGEDALLLTADKDFGGLVFRDGLQHRGVMLLRLPEGNLFGNAVLTSLAIAEHGLEMRNRIAVLKQKGLRIRKWAL